MDGFHMFPFGFEFFGSGMIFWWLLWIVVAYLVYRDAEKRSMNGLLWFVLVLIPVLGFVFLIIYLVLREEKSGNDRALEILKERLARGEISFEEFEKMKKELKG